MLSNRCTCSMSLYLHALGRKREAWDERVEQGEGANGETGKTSYMNGEKAKGLWRIRIPIKLLLWRAFEIEDLAFLISLEFLSNGLFHENL